MNLDRFTEKAQESIVLARELAIKMDQQQVDSEHLALALVEQEDGLIPRILWVLGVNPGDISHQLNQELERRPKIYGSAATEVYNAASTRRLLLPRMKLRN